MARLRRTEKTNRIVEDIEGQGTRLPCNSIPITLGDKEDDSSVLEYFDQSPFQKDVCEGHIGAV